MSLMHSVWEKSHHIYIYIFASPLFSTASVRVNLLNGFSAVAVTLCPVARCLGLGWEMWGEFDISIKHTFQRG